MMSMNETSFPKDTCSKVNVPKKAVRPSRTVLEGESCLLAWNILAQVEDGADFAEYLQLTFGIFSGPLLLDEAGAEHNVVPEEPFGFEVENLDVNVIFAPKNGINFFA